VAGENTPVEPNAASGTPSTVATSEPQSGSPDGSTTSPSQPGDASGHDRSAAVDPTQVRLVVRGARKALEANQPATAESLAAWAVVFAPDNAGAWNVLGRAQLALGRLNDAESSFRRACDVDSTSAWAHNNLAWVRLQFGDYKAAIPLLETAVRS